VDSRLLGRPKVKVFINTDAAVGPKNPGPAGAGYVIVYQAETGWDTVVGAVPLNWRTHHEAEYEAAILALTHAARLGATSALLRTDSRLLVRQMNDQSAVKAPQLVSPAKRLRSRRERFGKNKVKIVWIDRKKNKAADKLAGFAREKSARRKAYVESSARSSEARASNT
jgi:ribonuclease HI